MKIASDLKLEHEIFDRINCCRDNSIRCLRKIAPVTKINYATCELLYYACKVEVVRIYYAVVFSVSTQWKDIKWHGLYKIINVIELSNLIDFNFLFTFDILFSL